MSSQIHSPSQQVLAKPSLGESAYTGGATVKGLGVDTLGYTRAQVIFHVIAHDHDDANETLDVKIQTSVDNVDGDFADVAGAAFTQIAAQAITGTSGNTYLMDLNLENSKFSRWIRPVATQAGTTPSDTFSVQILLYNGNYQAVAQDNTVIAD